MQKSSAQQQQQQPEVASAEGQQVTITLQHHGQLEENFAQANDTYLHHHHHSHQANVFLDPLFGATTETFKIKPSMSVCIHITYLPYPLYISEPQGSIFQNGFLDGVQFKFCNIFTNF